MGARSAAREGAGVSAVPMRIVHSSATAPLQRSFAGFLPVTVVVYDFRRKRVTVECRAPRPRPEQLPLAIVVGAPLVARTPAAPPVPIRVPALRPYVPRRSLPGARARSLGTKRISQRAAREALADIRELEAAGYYTITPDGEVERGPLFPRVYGDCEDMVPRVLEDGSKGWCPFVSCRMHLKYDVDDVSGAVKDMFPDKELWELEDTCALRWVEARKAEGGDNAEIGDQTLRRVGLALNQTMESVRLTADQAIAKVRRRVDIRELRRLLAGGTEDETED